MASGKTPATPRPIELTLPEDDATLRERFLSLKSRAGVASLLHISEQELIYLIYRPRPRYKEFVIATAAEGVRSISAPVGSLKIVQQKLAQVLNSVYRVRPPVHGFVRFRSVKTNALRHQGQRWVLNIDLRNFFGTIHFGRVLGMFRAVPYNIPLPAAKVLAQFCCHLGTLPQGAPTSPVVSNMVAARLDSHLLTLAQRFRCVYTRYADDITFSTSAKQFPRDLASVGVDETGRVRAILGSALAATLQQNSFESNTAKGTLRGPGTRQQVTNVTVNEFPNVPRAFIKQLRGMLHAWETYGEPKAQDEYRRRYTRHRRPDAPPISFARAVKGKFAYLRMIKGEADPVYVRLALRLAVLDPNFRAPTTAALSPGRRNLVGETADQFLARVRSPSEPEIRLDITMADAAQGPATT
jgi:RNA-directed DNA polymerase